MPKTKRPKAKRPKPRNKKLWDKVKAEAKEKFKVYPSAYANAWLSKEYKRRGGTFSGSRARSSLAKRLREEWESSQSRRNPIRRKRRNSRWKPRNKKRRSNPAKQSKRCSGVTKSGRRCRRHVHRTHCPSHKNQRNRKTRSSRGRRTRTRRRRNPSCGWTHVKFSHSDRSGKKLKAVFTQTGSKRKKTTHFGATGYSDYTIHKNKARRAKYISRHKARENWNKCDSAGALSRWVLWGDTTSLSGAQAAFRRKFGLKSGTAK